ncbi:unnamed protein product [Adineta steineri]|uniref:Uncharacterized protein n=1 Tax=Adineta steineri TaxID=433720 RepID=A0A815EA87_9BILA|nr:unnamed protein product [Adineta steineri]CAF1309794.1 unnamed protein product [Adineta steineri]CAF1577648.1 unnamed protein product [Adineta steineri]CAF1579444.1 unnamed protein product [Adineta steineri]
MDKRLQSNFSTNLNESSLHRKQDSDSTMHDILSNSATSNHEKQSGDSLAGLLNNNNNVQQDIARMPTFQQQIQMNRSKTNHVPLNSETIQQQHYDFIKKYKSAKTKLESQLKAARAQELTSGGQPSDMIKRNTILNKLSQLEAIKNKHLTRTIELKRQTQQSTSATAVKNIEQKDLPNSLFSSSSTSS